MVTTNKIPKHVAIIMDGNGRWAKKRGLPRSAGHKAGIETVREIVKASKDLGIKVLTVYAFSIENWTRPKREVSFLMRYLENFLTKYTDELNQNDVRFMAIGRIAQPLPLSTRQKLMETMEATKANSSLVFNLALNYGGRQEIVDATKGIVEAVKVGIENPSMIDETVFSKYLYTADLPDPDLLIRTSGELRISNFLLWQISYSEIYITPRLWPDFKKRDLVEAIEEYSKRERRFGDIKSVTEKDS